MTQAPGRVALAVIGGLAFAVASIPGLGGQRGGTGDPTWHAGADWATGLAVPDCWSVAGLALA
ncbi:MAG: hypothetical protein IPM00_06935 [Tetrasphaera sp.]|nr:hypothetical protein [Tetrasphaera sp.]